MNQNKKGFLTKKRKRILVFLLIIFVLLFIPFWIYLGKWARSHGFDGAGDFVKTVTVNYWNSFDAKYETIEITISESDFQKFSDQRELHLKRGIITKQEDRYVPAIITHNDSKIKCKIRLKGHMLDHLQDKKWSFRVKTKGGDAFLGMRIFSLQHPGTRNYIYEWIYHQMLLEEGIATIRYKFLNLKLNGESWGIYAVEENFGNELLQNNKLPDGPILGFNPDLYWNARLNHHDKINVDLSDFDGASSSPEAYNEDELLKSDLTKEQFREAILKLEKFKKGELKTSEVFDIDKLARFHAIIDLVGGHASLDWSDVKYYYNPYTKKMEPIGYESFSVQNTQKLCGAEKYKNHFYTEATLHERIFSDPEFYSAYNKHLLRVSNSNYLDRFFKKHESELKNNLNILYTEFPYKKLELTAYYVNQKNIKALLNTPITTIVYVDSDNSDSLLITAGNSSVYPVIIKEIDVNGKRLKLNKPIRLSSRRKNEHVYYEHFKILNPIDSLNGKIELIASYPGLGETWKIKALPMKMNLNLDENNFPAGKHYSQFNLFIEKEDELYFNKNEITISENITIPKEKKLIISEGCKINLMNHSAIIINGKIQVSGTDELPVEFLSEDSTGRGLIFLSCKEKSFFNFAQFYQLNTKSDKSETFRAMITVYQSSVEINNSVFSGNSKFGIEAVRSDVICKNSEFLNFEKSGLKAEYSKIRFLGVLISNCKEGVDLNGSNGYLKSTRITQADEAMRFDNGSLFNIENSKVLNSSNAIIATDHSKLNVKNIQLVNVKIGFTAEKKSDVFGPAQIDVKGLKKEKVKTVSESDKKSKIKIH